MSLSLILGYGGALGVGLLLSLVGGGGAILSLPLFVYAFGLSPWQATTYSLFVVGAAAAIGAVREARQGQIDYRAAARFALPAMVAIHLVRRYAMPYLPNAWSLPGGISITKDAVIMTTLAAAMVAAALSVMRRPATVSSDEASVPPSSLPKSSLRGFVVGLFTGLVGAGGGFLLVPALSISERMTIKRAVATSLFVIALNSAFGFVGDMTRGVTLDWPLLLRFAGAAGVGMILGARWTASLSERQVRRAFGVTLLALAVVVVLLELKP